MTSILFRVFGGLAVLIGLVWTALVVAVAFSASPAPAIAADTIGRAMAAAPGVGLIFSGLLLMAIGEALWHLERIARSAAKIVHNTADIRSFVEGADSRPRADAATSFGDAIQLFQARTGTKEPVAAIRDLATDALRHRGYLR